MTDEPRDPWTLQRWAYRQKTGNPARKAILLALAITADTNTGRCEALRATLAEWAEVSPDTVSSHLKALASELSDQGRPFIARREQKRYDGGRRGDEFLILAPGVTHWPDGSPAPLPKSGEGVESGEGPSPTNGETGTTASNDHAPGGRSAGASAPAKSPIPDDFPDELRPHLEHVWRTLKPVAEGGRNAKAIVPMSLALVVMARPRKPLVKAAHDYAAWAVGKGYPHRDVVAGYRNWLEREQDLAGPETLPGEAGPAPTGPAPRGGSERAQREAAKDWRTQERLRVLQGGAEPGSAVG